MQEEFLLRKLRERQTQDALRSLRSSEGKVDFCSNDYLGLAKSFSINLSKEYAHGSGGSRLLAGNYAAIEEAETLIAGFHQAKAGLIFNSGYDANLGLLSSVPQRGDTILYDYLSHASIRDGIRLSFAEAFSFLHNDINDLENKLKKAKGNVFVVTESLFSMDGDLAPLHDISRLCIQFGAHLIVDEAHATGIIGNSGEGLVQSLGIAEKCFARVHTFGKALGCHGAIILGSETLRNYLINFARSFMYTTALPESSVAAIRRSYELFPSMQEERRQLQSLIDRFKKFPVQFSRIESNTAIQAVVVPGNKEVKQLADTLQRNKLDVRPILYPTVPRGGERLRIVLHAFNNFDELDKLCELLR
jgi:8-amino-7-oxononanoate synthase